MERWAIRPEPTPDDPQRHLLLIRGGMTDVAALLKKFGSMCGRPSPHAGGGFNLSLVLHRVSPASRRTLDEWLGQLAPGGDEDAELPASVPRTSTTPASVTNMPAPAPAPPMPSPAPAPAPAPPPPMPSLSPAPAAPEPAGPSIPPLVPPPVAMPVIAAAVPNTPPPTEVLPPVPSIVTPMPGVSPSELPPVNATPPGPVPTETRLASPAPGPAAEPAGAAASASPPPPAPITDPLREDWTFDSLLVGAYNRFAHAAATSVVSAPGTMYNPLFLYGVPGTGKSRLLHSIAGALSKGLGDATTMLTSGARLSRAVTLAQARGSMAEIDKKVKESKALFVDDVHLMAITEQNKDALARVFKSFFDDKRQVVITSLYPPKALGALEEALKFSFSKGWSVDLKVPGPNVQKDLIMAVSDKAGLHLNNDEGTLLHEKLAHWGYAELSLWAARLALLRDKREGRGEPIGLQELLIQIYEPIIAGAEGSQAARSAFAPPAPTDKSEPLAVISPKARDGIGSFAASLFYETGGKHGFQQAYRHVLWETYDDQQQVGVPFQIADICHKAAVTRALVIGPTPDSALGPRSPEFGHAVRHILESVGVRTGWVPFNGLYVGAHYLNAHLDFNKL